MGCTIEQVLTKNNKSSDLWKSLTESMNTRDALEYYLELETNQQAYKEVFGENAQGEVMPHTATKAKFRLVEFDEYEDQEDTMNYLSNMVISSLRQQAGIKSDSSIAGFNFNAIANDPTAIPKAIKDVRNTLKDYYSDESLSENQSELILNAIININRYMEDGGRLGRLGQRLQDLGIPIRITSKKTIVDQMADEKLAQNEEADVELLENQYERIYDMEIIETSPLTSVLSGVQTYIKQKYAVDSNYKYARNKNIKYKQTNLGSFKAVDYEKIMNKLYSGLTGIQTIDQMIVKLQVMAETSPELAPIVEDVLNEAEGPPSTHKVGDTVYEYNPIASSLFSTFARHNYDMFSIVREPNGNIYFSNANKSAVQTTLKAEWARNVPKNMKTISDTAKTVRINTIMKYTKNPEIKNTLNNAVSADIQVINQAAGILQKAGFDATNKDLFAIKTLYVNDKSFIKGNYKYSDIIEGLLLTLARNSYKGINVFESTALSKEESRYLNLLATAVGMRKDDITLGAFYSGRNSVLHPINSAAEAHDVWSRVTQDEEFLGMLKNDPVYMDTRILRALEDPIHSVVFRPRFMDSLVENNSGFPGITYGKLSSPDAIAMKMNGYFIGEGNKSYMRAFSPTQGDRGNISTIGVPKLNVDKNGRDLRIFDKDGKVTSDEVSKWVVDTITSEVNRIANAKNYRGKHKVKNYHNGNAERFNLFPELNDLVKVGRNRQKAVSEAVGHILGTSINSKKLLRSMIDADMEFVMENNLLKPGDNLGYKITDKGKSVISPTLKFLNTNQFENFLLNNIVYTHEQTLFYAGDMAYFNQNSEKAPFAQKVDLNKRFALPFTPGTKLAVGDYHGIGSKAKIKIVVEPKMDSKRNNIYKELFGTRAFTDIELADGAGFVSLKRYRQLLMSRGLHNDSILKLIDDLINKRKVSSDATLEVFKGFYYRLQKGEHGAVMPFNMKYSIVPAIPSLFEATDNSGRPLHPGMNAISKELNSDKVGTADEIVMESAVKVGAVNRTSIENLSENQGIFIHNDSYRFPQPSPTKNKVTNLSGSQMRVLAEANMPADGTYHVNDQSVSTEQAQMDYQQALSTVIEAGGTTSQNTFISNGELDTENLIDNILDALSENSYNNVEYFKEALEIVGNDLVLPLNYPTLKFKLDNMINANFRSNVNRFELPGYSAVQMSSMGMAFSKDAISTDSDLSFVGLKHKDGRELTPDQYTEQLEKLKKGVDISENYQVIPAEIRVTPRYFLKRLEQIAGDQVNQKVISELVTEHRNLIKEADPSLGPNAVNILGEKERQRLLKQAKDKNYDRLKRLVVNKDGSYDLNAIKEAGLDQLVLYRIPTQGKSTMLPAAIKAFLPESFGSSVQVPAEIVKQAGSDFDIDKIILEMFSFNEKGGKLISHRNNPNISELSQAKANIVEFHRAVLTSTSHFLELLQPNNTQKLKELADSMGFGDAQMTAGWPTLATQEVFRSNNQAGKDMISISSVASIAHALAQKVGTHFTLGMKLGSEDLVELGKIRNEYGELISDEIGLVQNAALDNAKDPLLGKLNINEFTSSVVLLAVEAGKGIEYATTLVNAPIIRDLAKEYATYTRTNPPRSALSKAQGAVEVKYKIRAKNATVRLSTYDLETAKQALDITSNSFKELQQRALKAFLEIKKVGDQLANVQRALNFGSKGTPASTSALIEKYREISRIPGTLAHQRENGKLPGKSPLLTAEYGKKLKDYTIGVNQQKYAAHSLSSFERNAIHKAFEVNRIASPTASPQVQRIINISQKSLGRLTEGQQLKLIASYDHFLVSNKNAVDGNTPWFASYMQNKLHMNLTDPTSPKSVSNLISKYKDKIRREGKDVNLFIDNLIIVEKDNREYITFKNTTANVLTGNRKSSMMFYFESLMGHPENSIEAQLAESLTLYALSHYGFAKDINSFMEFIPPIAHRAYTQETGKHLSDFYKDLNLEQTEDFADPYVFLDMYVQNNAHRLPLKRIGPNSSVIESYIDEDSGKEHMYVLKAKDKTFKEFDLWKKGHSRPIGFRGIPQLLSDYSVTSDIAADTPGIAVSSTDQKYRATPENQKVMNTFEAMDYVHDVVMNETLIDTVHDAAQADKVIAELNEKYTEGLSPKMKEHFFDSLNSASKVATITAAKNSISYNQAFKDVLGSYINSKIVTVPKLRDSLVEIIKTCS